MISYVSKKISEDNKKLAINQLGTTFNILTKGSKSQDEKSDLNKDQIKLSITTKLETGFYSITFA
jgi:hypothetical protein